MAREGSSSRTCIPRFLVGLPPGASDPGLLFAASEYADPLVDLRYGTPSENTELVRTLLQSPLRGLTVILRGPEELQALGGEFRSGDRVILPAGRMPTEAAVRDLRYRGVEVGFELFDDRDTVEAVQRGATFLLASGHEAYGPVSSRTTLILVQELLKASSLPVFVRGSLGPLGCAAVFAAGASACILDSQVLLTTESPLGRETKELIRGLAPTDTGVLGREVDRPIRMLARPGLTPWRDLTGRYDALFKSDPAPTAEQIRDLVGASTVEGFGGPGPLYPVGQGVAFAGSFDGAGIRETLILFDGRVRKALEDIGDAFPYREGAPLSRSHGTRLPLVQGPLSNIAENPAFAEKVHEAGALPFLALSSLPVERVRTMIRETRERLGERKFGVGLIGYAVSKIRDAHIDAILEEKPPYVTVAGGDPELAHRFDAAGISTYLHAPTPAHVASFLRQGATRIILEGHEAGGHIGALGSLVLWELAQEETLGALKAGVKAEAVLFAGGLSGPVGSLMASVIARPLEQAGIPTGLQIGTAYLFTPAIVETGAASPAYLKTMIHSTGTVSFGHSINLPTRCADTSFPRRMRKTERELAGDPALSLEARKERIELDNRGHLRIAAKAIEHNPDPSGPRYLEVDESRQLDEGAFHAGQSLALIPGEITLERLHRGLTKDAAALAADLRVGGHEEDRSSLIAIVGMGCLTPGAEDPETLWKNILDRRSFVREVPPEVWDSKTYHRPEGTGTLDIRCNIGAFLNDWKPDPTRYRIPPAIAESMDPVHLMALELATRTVEDAGYQGATLPRERTAVVLGSTPGGDHLAKLQFVIRVPLVLKTLSEDPAFKALPEKQRSEILKRLEQELMGECPAVLEDSWYVGQVPSVIAGRIGSLFDLQGGCAIIDTACGSGLAAIEIATEGLRSRKYDAVLAGALELRMGAFNYLGFDKLGALSSKGSFPYDERASGFVMGEGGGMVLLKRLDDALRDGDRIYAVIRAIGTSNDGKTKGMTAPRHEGQLLALDRAYREAAISPRSVSLIEGHGTGTVLGDETEIKTLNRIFGDAGASTASCGLGSIKSQMGHLRCAAGLVGLLKATLAVYHKTLPPTINCEQPTPKLKDTPFYLVTEPLPWKKSSHPRRAGVNAFGFGGLNHHVILEEPPAAEGQPTGPADTHELFLFAGADRAAVLKQAGRLLDSVQDGADLLDLSLQLGRQTRRGHRVLAVVADSIQDLKRKLAETIRLLEKPETAAINNTKGVYYEETPDPDEKVVFLCPGQGTQYPGMAEALCRRFPAARRAFDVADRQVQLLRGHTITELVWPGRNGSGGNGSAHQDSGDIEKLLTRTDNSHPTIIATSLSTTTVLELAGLRPDMTAGHSLGEYTAMFLAGVCDLETLLELVNRRGTAMQTHAGDRGTMAAVFGPIAKIEEILADVPGFVAPSNRNCPNQTVISGETEAVQEAARRLNAAGLSTTLLRVNVPFHSKMVAVVAESVRQGRGRVRIGAPRIPVQSNANGSFHPMGQPFVDGFWDAIGGHVTSPVNFHGNIESLYEAGGRLFLEMGPGSALTGFVDDTLSGRPYRATPTLLRHGSEVAQLLKAIGIAAARGHLPDLDRLNAGRRPTRARTPLQRAEPTSLPGAAPAKPEGLLPESLLPERLKKLPAAERERYLKSREGFLRDMIRNMIDADLAHSGASAPATDAPESSGRAAEIVLAAFSGKTGYPVDALERGLDVEADLGIDSIKQTEIVKSIRESIGNEEFTIGREARTVGDWIGAVQAVTGPETGAEDPGVETLVLSVFAEKTGYPVDALDRSLDIEADLGIDSIKQTEILKTIREKAGLGEEAASLGRDIRTVGDWITAVARVGGEVVQPAHPVAKEATAEYRTDCRRFTASLEAATGESGSLKDQQVLILPGPAAEKVVERLTTLGAQPRILTGKDSIEATPRFLLDLTASDPDRSDLDEAARSLFDIAASLERVATDAPCRIVVVTPPQPTPLSGLHLGLWRCVRRERKAFSLHTLQATPDPDVVAEELARVTGDDAIVICDGERSRVTWTEGKTPEPIDPPPLTKGSVVLAIGGTRGVTGVFVEALGKSHAPTLIVTGRAEPEDPAKVPDVPADGWPTLRAELLEAARAAGEKIVPARIDAAAWRELARRERAALLRKNRVHYRRLDLLDADATRELVKQIRSEFGRLDLVIHGAAELYEKMLEKTDPGKFIDVVRVRTHGTQNLLAALDDHPPATLLNVGTAAALYGSPGLSAYASGHQAAAHMIERWGASTGCRARNLIFGSWLNVGMTRQGEIMKRHHEAGQDFVTRETGGKFFLDELLGGNEVHVAFHGHRRRRPPAKAPGMLETLEANGSESNGTATFSLEKDAWIDGHRVAGEAYFPGVYGVELMVETAAPFVRDTEVKAIENVELVNPVRFPGGRARTLHTRTRRLEDGRVAGEVYTRIRKPDGGWGERPHFRCTIIPGERPAPPAPDLPVVGEGLIDKWARWKKIDRVFEWETERSDREGAFDTVRDVASISIAGIHGNVQAEDPEALQGRLFLNNVAMLDACIHIITPWAGVMKQAPVGVITELEAVRFYGNANVPSRGHVLCRITEVAEDWILLDTDLLDGEGRVVVSLRGVKRFGVRLENREKAVEALHRGIGWRFESDSVRDLLGAGKIVLTRLEIPGTWETEGIPKEEVARLSEAEQARLARFKPPKRRAEFVAGRLAAKAAVAGLLGRVHAPDPAVSIESNGNGPLSVATPWDAKAHVSISHAGGLAFAAASEERIGVDVERMTDDLLRIRKGYARDEELETVRTAGAADEHEALATVWVAKEAFVKQLRSDTPPDLKRIRVTGAVRMDEHLRLELECDNARAVALCRRIGERMLGVAIPATPSPTRQAEDALRSHPTVGDAVIAKGIGYVVPKDGMGPTISELQAFAAEQIPETSRPPRFLVLQSLPFTAEGEIDTDALPVPPPVRTRVDEKREAPADPWESRLTRIWERALGISPIGPKDNFFSDLGGTSMLALHLFADIQKEFGIELNPTVLIKSPTVAQLLEVLRGRILTLSDAYLVPIQPAGTKPPLYLIHPAGGSVLAFADLARRLDPDQPIYGLQGRGMDGKQGAHASIEEMAAAYLKEIEDANPEGPYRLAGVCMGGIVGFEMAQQLRARGKKVQLVAILDATVPPPLKEGTLPKRFMQEVDNRLKTFNFYWRNNRRRLLGKKLPKELLRVPERHAKLAEAHIANQLRYVARPYPGRVTLFFTGRQQEIVERQARWEEVAAGGMDRLEVPGHHDTILFEPHVKGLAEKLQKVLDSLS